MLVFLLSAEKKGGGQVLLPKFSRILNSDGCPIPVLPYLYFSFSCSLISTIWLKNIFQKDIWTCLKIPSDEEFTTSLT